jgi:hypothetical protein
MSQQIGANHSKSKGLFKVTFGKSKSKVMEFISGLSENNSHRWIPFHMVSELGHLWVTERQANWLVSMVKSRMKVSDFDIARVIEEN